MSSEAGVAVSPTQQRKEVVKINDAGSELLSVAEPGDSFFVINMTWFVAWKEHVDWEEEGKNGPAPGPIDNTSLMQSPGSQRLRNPAGTGSEFDVVSEKLWDKLVEWHTLAPGSPVIVRPVVFNGDSNIVEISAPVFDLWQANADTGPQGKRAPNGAQVVSSRVANVGTLFLSAYKTFLESNGQEENNSQELVRLWWSLGPQTAEPVDGEDDKPASTAQGTDDAGAVGEWHRLDFLSETTLAIGSLQVGDHNVAVSRKPRVLIEQRASVTAEWVLKSPLKADLESGQAGGDSDGADDTGSSSKASATKATSAAETRAQEHTATRDKVNDMSDADWRAWLAAGAECDCYDGRAWQESTVVRIDPPQEGKDEVVVVRFRRNGPDHVLSTFRAAGAAGAAALAEDQEHKFQKGDLAKPYTHVSDWRAQLRQDMKIELIEGKQQEYRNEEAGTTIHYLSRFREWWVSDHISAQHHSRRGYLNAVGTSDNPPVTNKKTMWELWTAVQPKIWTFSPYVKVELVDNGEGPGKEDVRISADPEELKKVYKGFGGKPEKFCGLFKRQANASWVLRKVAKVDYKKRLVTLVPPYGYGGFYSSGRAGVTMSLDSDSIREMALADNSDDSLGLGDVKDVCTRLDTSVAGLRNMGNTCFMNSVLQSLFSLRELTHFFADKKLVDAQLNTENFLGTGGKLAKAYHRLLRKVAACSGGVVERDGQLFTFKLTLGNFAPVFAGFQQQDAMEFFNQFTSLVHEDMNRIKKKPYVEDIDDEGQSDASMADQSWTNYLLRNDSIIVDLLQGQFRSHLTCPKPECGYESRRFDPFSAIACPLPKAPKRKLQKTVRVFTLDALRELGALGGSEPASASKSGMPSTWTFSAVLNFPMQGGAVVEMISEHSGIPVERLLLAETYHGRIFRVIFDAKSRISTTFSVNEEVIAYEIPENFDPQKEIMLEVRFLGTAAHSPVLLPTPRTQATTQADVLTRVNQFMQKRVLRDPAALSADTPLPRFSVGDHVKWDGGGEGKEGVVTQWRIGYGRVPTKVCVKVDGMGRYVQDKLPEDLEHAFDFRSSAEDWIKAHSPAVDGEADAESEKPLYTVQYIDAETYYQKSPATSPWKKSKTAHSYDIHPLLPSTKKCPCVAAVIVQWQRDLLLVADPEFDSKFVHPQEWSKDMAKKEDTNNAKPVVLSLHNSLRQHMDREQLGKNDQWYCRGCKEHVRAYKKMDIWRLPPLLVFQLKRFSYEVGKFTTLREKLDSYVDFPFEINMSDYVIGPGGTAVVEGQDEDGVKTSPTHSGGPSESTVAPSDEEMPSMMYELVAVSNHMGGLAGGHYTAYTKRGDQWFDCNDSSTRPVKKEQVKSSAAYVLFYRRVEAEEMEAGAVGGGKEEAATASAEVDGNDSGDVTPDDGLESKDSTQ